MIDEQNIIRKIEHRIDAFVKQYPQQKDCEQIETQKEFIHMLKIEAKENENTYNRGIDDFAERLRFEYQNAVSIPAIEKETAYAAINKVAEQLKTDHPVKENED